ncbi:MAG TPA: FAD-dependent oxidoreductase [Syntrophomonas sp.]|jgi:electron transfer flavoprotein-quinone oxidoreductase|nr:FAD-dependent oxidoreductase [Syntrophomonas sp.]
MSNEGFDVIVVGAGVAGTVAAYLLGREGLQVLLIERGNYSGSKNMTGGRIYSHSLEKIMPDFAQEAPIERKITREKVFMMTEKSSIGLDFQSSLLGAQGSDSYSVLRGVFDQWLAEKAEEVGVEIITGICVDDLIIRQGKVCGVIAGTDQIESGITILADGINSLLAQKAGLREEFKPNQVAVGVKELIELPGELIQERFQCDENEGTACMFAGFPSDGRVGGGFLYTNKESISLGVVCTLSDLVKGQKAIPQLMEDFKMHPSVAPLIRGGRLVEYSGHLVPEGGVEMMPKIIGDGVLVVGDAAGFCVNLGYAVRGMDFAIASGECAAQAVIKAYQGGGYSEGNLQAYRSYLEESFVLRDMKLYRNFPKFLETTPRVFSDYPKLLEGIMADMFVMDGEPTPALMKIMMKHLNKVGVLKIARDAWKGVRAL